ncbi:MAG: hypothetical protein KGH55_01520 [Nanoarchaeota archaeon]|nr:hypothetical protein [Nanoarchaeota archaeon]
MPSKPERSLDFGLQRYIPANLKGVLFPLLRTGDFYRISGSSDGYSVSFVGGIEGCVDYKKIGHFIASGLPSIFAKTPAMSEPLPLLMERNYFNDDYDPEGGDTEDHVRAFVVDSTPARREIGQYRRVNSDEPDFSLVNGVEFFKLQLKNLQPFLEKYPLFFLI